MIERFSITNCHTLTQSQAYGYPPIIHITMTRNLVGGAPHSTHISHPYPLTHASPLESIQLSTMFTGKLSCHTHICLPLPRCPSQHPSHLRFLYWNLKKILHFISKTYLDFCTMWNSFTSFNDFQFPRFLFHFVVNIDYKWSPVRCHCTDRA